MPQSTELVGRTRFLAKAVLLGAVALLVLLIGTFLVVNHASMPEMIIIFWGLFILIAALIAGIAAAYLFLARAQATTGPTPAPTPIAPTAATAPELEDLAVRLLDGDERRLLRVIVEAHGDILQRDLVRMTAFSDAKVSRLLDRLQERGLVVRERQGMTNRVRLTLRQT